jgi:hypothetical protein
VLVYIGKARHRVEERTFDVLRKLLLAHPEVSPAEFKAALREQWAILAIDERAAIETLPQLLPTDETARRAFFDSIRAIVTATGGVEVVSTARDRPSSPAVGNIYRSLSLSICAIHRSKECFRISASVAISSFSIDHCRVVVCPPCHLGMLDLEVGGLLSCSAMKNPLLVQVGDPRIDPNSKARQFAAYFVDISRHDDLPLG